MSDIIIDRVLNLKNEKDKHYLLNKLRQYPNISTSYEDFDKSISFLSDELADEWLTVYPGGRVGVKVGPRRSKGYGLFSDVVPLGLDLIQLSELEKFERLITRLNIPSHERISTILEISTASNYKRAGFSLDLEPSSGNSGSADFRVKYNDEWVYFECKAENLEESKYYKKNTEYVNELVGEILRKVVLDPAHRIDIILTIKPNNDERRKLTSEICHSLLNKEFRIWKKMAGVSFAINPKQSKIRLPPKHVRMYQMTVGTTPTKLTPENANVQVIFNPFGRKEVQKLRRIIKEAKSQIPKSSRGIIIIKTLHATPLVDILNEKLIHSDYHNIIAGLAIGNDSIWIVRNNKHQDVPLEFCTNCVRPLHRA